MFSLLLYHLDMNINIYLFQQAYHRYMAQFSRNDDESIATKCFMECKDLSSRLSGTFAGAARNKYRFDILKIVKEGIEYAFVNAPRQLSFLEGSVLHFVSKLPTPDIADM